MVSDDAQIRVSRLDWTFMGKDKKKEKNSMDQHGHLDRGRGKLIELVTIQKETENHPPNIRIL